MKSKIDIPIKILNILGDLVLFSYLFFINLEILDILIGAMTIVVTLKVLCRLIIQKGEEKYIYILATILTFILAITLELLLSPDNILAFNYFEIPIIIFLPIYFVILILNILKNKPILK